MEGWVRHAFNFVKQTNEIREGGGEHAAAGGTCEATLDTVAAWVSYSKKEIGVDENKFTLRAREAK
eukprot:1864640-Amphidinium_carterae.1